MFNFIRSIYRRVYIIILLFLQSFFEVVKSLGSDEENSNWLEECAPIRSNKELIDYVRRPFSWNSLVEPLTTKCCPRKYGEHYKTIHETDNSAFEFPNERSRPKVLVCHDMAGNYREDRFIHGSKKYDDYRFYHWAGIDIFVYFSHYYVTIPPLSWINAGHRNGVPVLGTIIIEFDAAKHLLDGLLRSKHDTNRYIEALVLVTKNFGFDGWLLNVECRADREQVPLLKAFTRQLTARIHEEIPEGTVIWYDSVTEAGKLDWQNEVNEKNIDMYRGSDGILLNYGWSIEHLQRTIDILQRDQVEMAKVYVGVDVFGRSHIAGFYTHETVRRIHDCNLSIGIFAPAWTFERMPDEHPLNSEGRDEINERFLERNTLFWSLLWRYLFTSGPNTLPFYTSFCLGSGKRLFRSGLRISNKPWFNLMEQQYQPSVPSPFEQYLYDDAYHGGSCIKFNRTVRNARVFVTDFECINNLVASFVFKRSDSQIDVQLVLNVQNQNGDKTLLVYCESDGRDQLNVNRSTTHNRFLVRPLQGQLLKYTVIGLSNRNEKIFPSSNRPINGWETRYYYLNFDEMAKYGRLIDIGISINKNRWLRSDFVLLGALNIHSGIAEERYITEHLDLISFDAEKPAT